MSLCHKIAESCAQLQLAIRPACKHVQTRVRPHQAARFLRLGRGGWRGRAGMNRLRRLYAPRAGQWTPPRTSINLSVRQSGTKTNISWPRLRNKASDGTFVMWPNRVNILTI